MLLRVTSAGSPPRRLTASTACPFLDNFTSRNPLHQFPISLKEIIRRQILARDPSDGLKYPVADCSAIRWDQKEDYLNVAVRVAMAQAEDFLAHVSLDGQFLREFPLERTFQILLVADLAARELPLQAVRVRPVALANQYPIAIYYDASRDQNGFCIRHERTQSILPQSPCFDGAVLGVGSVAARPFLPLGRPGWGRAGATRLRAAWLDQTERACSNARIARLEGGSLRLLMPTMTWRKLTAARVGRLALGAALILAASTPGLWSSSPRPPAETEPAWEKYLVPDAPEVTFRFMVAHDHGLGSWNRFCLGYLFITREEIRYEVLRPRGNLDHAFRLPRQAILEAGQWRGLALGLAPAAEFKFAKGKVYHFYHVKQRTLDKNPHTILIMRDVLPWPPVAQLALRFDEVAVLVRPPAAPAAQPRQLQPPATAEKAPESAGPKVRVMEPEVEDPSVPVEVTEPVLTLRGAAADPKGVLSVVVNDRQAELRSVGDVRIMEFSLKDLQLQEGLNRLTVVATNVDHQSTQLIATLWLRTKAAPTPAPTAGPAQKPLTKGQILELLRGYVQSSRVATLVEERGIDFEPADDYFKEVRAVGGEEVLIEALRKARRVKPSSTQSPPATE